MSRREFSKTLLSSASGAGLYTLLSSCGSLQRPQDVRELPRGDFAEFGGKLVFDDMSRQAAADDFGHIVHQLPAAVLNPTSIEDVVKMVRFANRRGVKLAMNGNSHSCFGHAQAENGVVIQSGGLKAIHGIDANTAHVDAGVTWGELVKATLARGLTPPVLPEFQDLSVGGTLSLGGLGGASHRLGAQVDHVLQLEVITGAGELLTCSVNHNRQLFDSLLAGFGQSALIVRATIRLVPAPTHVMVQNLVYRDLGTYLADALRAAQDERFDHQLGRVSFEAEGRPAFRLEAGRFYSEPSKPDLADAMAGFRFTEAMKPVTYTYWDYLNQRPAVVRPAKGWYLPHATLYLFLPVSEIEGFLNRMLGTPSEYAGARIPALLGIYPLNTRHFTRPLFQVPKGGEQFFALYLFRTAPADDPGSISAMVGTNRTLYERALAAGGTQYPVTAVPLTPSDWREHFGAEAWKILSSAKRQYDPKNVLTPGPGIFSSGSS
jgi:FAD/FMN-containing dehydrogenase